MSDPTAHGPLHSDVTADLAVPAVALAIGAHPDDIEFGCGGTLAKWAAAGCLIHHLVLTDGSKGTWDDQADIAQLIRDRQEEQRDASRRLGGAGRVTFLGYTDGELQAGLEQRSEVARCIREVRPDVVLGHDPWRRYRLHPDHRNAGFLATDGIVAARDPFFFPEHRLEPHRPAALLLWEADSPDHIEDISAYSDQKLHALLAHRSQFRSTMRIGDTATADAETAAFADRLRDRQRQAGLPLGLAAAEAFKLMKDL